MFLNTNNFKSFSRSLEQFFLTVGQDNFGNKIPFLDGINLSQIIFLGLGHRITACPKLEAINHKKNASVGRRDYLADTSADY